MGNVNGGGLLILQRPETAWMCLSSAAVSTAQRFGCPDNQAIAEQKLTGVSTTTLFPLFATTFPTRVTWLPTKLAISAPFTRRAAICACYSCSCPNYNRGNNRAISANNNTASRSKVRAYSVAQGCF